MKKIALAFMALLTLSQAVVAKNVTVQTKGMSLVIDVENGKHPTFVYFGHKISDADISNLTTPGNYSHQEIYLPYGPAPQAEPAFAARHYDGNMSTELNAVGYDQWQDGTSTVTTIHLKDPQYGLTVDVNYRAYKDVDMIETWTDIKNGEKGTVTLTDFYSAVFLYVAETYGSALSTAHGPTRDVSTRSLSPPATR